METDNISDNHDRNVMTLLISPSIIPGDPLQLLLIPEEIRWPPKKVESACFKYFWQEVDYLNNFLRKEEEESTLISKIFVERSLGFPRWTELDTTIPIIEYTPKRSDYRTQLMNEVFEEGPLV